MIQILIKREYDRKTCCLGTLRILQDGEEIFRCKTLEEEIESDQRGQDHRIPPGRYKCFWHEKSRFRDSLTKLLNWAQDPLCIFNERVPADRYILFHSGNTHKDTEGCILLGKEIGSDGESIVKSRDATKEFYLALNRRNTREIEVIIEND